MGGRAFQFFLISTVGNNEFRAYIYLSVLPYFDIIREPKCARGVYFQFFLISTGILETTDKPNVAFSSSLFRLIFRRLDTGKTELSVLPYFDCPGRDERCWGEAFSSSLFRLHTMFILNHLTNFQFFLISTKRLASMIFPPLLSVLPYFD